ncbi:hypothetical protein JC200_20215 [Alicyclobacillus sp. ALC3]|nr:hypothetical protein JC200_20215 [Alicyclobacillus sp. ALC3]
MLDLKGMVSKDYQIIGYPTTFILEPNGTVQNVHVGLLTQSQVESLIANALKSSKTIQSKARLARVKGRRNECVKSSVASGSNGGFLSMVSSDFSNTPILSSSNPQTFSILRI